MAQDSDNALLGKRLYRKAVDVNHPHPHPHVYQVVALVGEGDSRKFAVKSLFSGKVAHLTRGEIDGVFQYISQGHQKEYPQKYLDKLFYRTVTEPHTLSTINYDDILSVAGSPDRDSEQVLLSLKLKSGDTVQLDVSHEKPKDIETFLMKIAEPRICVTRQTNGFSVCVVSEREYNDFPVKNRVEIPFPVSYEDERGRIGFSKIDYASSTTSFYVDSNGIPHKLMCVSALDSGGRAKFKNRNTREVFDLWPDEWSTIKRLSHKEADEMIAAYTKQVRPEVKESNPNVGYKPMHTSLDTLNDLLIEMYQREIPPGQVPSISCWRRQDTIYINMRDRTYTTKGASVVGYNTNTKEVTLAGDVVEGADLRVEMIGTRSITLTWKYKGGTVSYEALPVSGPRANPFPEDTLFHSKTGEFLYRVDEDAYCSRMGDSTCTIIEAKAAGYLPVDFTKTIWPLLFNNALKLKWQFTDTHFIMGAETGGSIAIPLMYLDWYKWLYYGYNRTGKNPDDAACCVCEDKLTGHKMLTTLGGILDGKHAAYDLYTEAFQWIDLSENPDRYVYLPKGETYQLDLNFVPEEYRHMANMTIEARGPASYPPNKADTASIVDTNPIADEKRKDLLTSAGYKILVSQISKACAVPLAAWASKTCSAEDAVRMESFLKTKAGQGMTTALLALVLSATDKRSVQSLAKEFRIMAMTQAGNSISDAILEPFLEEVKRSLAGQAEESKEPIASLPEPAVLSLQVDPTSTPEPVVTTIH